MRLELRKTFWFSLALAPFFFLWQDAAGQTTVTDTLSVRRIYNFRSPPSSNAKPGEIRFYDPNSESGDNYIGLRAPYTLSSSYNLVLPRNLGNVGEFLKLVTTDSLAWGTNSLSGVTVREVDLSPSVANITVLEVDESDGLVITNPSGAIARLDLSTLVSKLGQTIESSEITDGEITNVDVAASANLSLSKLAAGTSAQIPVANSLGVLTYRTIGGDVVVSDVGTVTISNSVISSAHIIDGVITEDDINSNIAGSGLVLTPGSPGTLDFAPSELTNITFSNGGAATATWIFSLSGATDPALNFGNNLLNVTNAQLQEGGANVFTLGDGALPIANGGTQTTTAPTDGQLFIGKTNGTYAVAELTEGANITITNGDGTITIAATGTGETNTASNLGGGLANFDSKSAEDLRFNTFLAADFDLASNVISIDDTKWAKDSELHAAVTLASDADVLLGLTTQQLTLDAQNANLIFAGPSSGGAADPTFRALVDDDIPNNITITNLSGANTGDVTLSGTPDYITISGQVITRGLIDLTTDVTGTLPDANVSNDLTLATVSGTIDAGGATSFEVPNGAGPTVDTFGEIAGDNNQWATGRGALVIYDGTAATALLGVLVSDTPSAGDIPKFNSDGTITWEADNTGSSPSWNSITAPTAATSFVSNATSETFTIDFQSAFTTGSQLVLKQSTGNPTGGVLFDVNTADADVTPLRMTAQGTSNGVQMNASGVLAPIGSGQIDANRFNGASGALTDDDLSNNSIDDLSDVTITSAAAAHLIVRNSGNTAWVNVALSGDGSLSAAGALTVNDDSHAHTSSTISGLDISDDTNLSVAAPIVLTGDQVGFNQAANFDWSARHRFRDADSDTLTVNPSGFSASNTFNAGTRIMQYKDAGVELFYVDSTGVLNAVTLLENGNAITSNAEALGGDLSGNLPNPAVVDDSHNHTGATLSGIDISDDTNLSAGTHLSMSGDAININDDFIINSGDAITGNLDFNDGSGNTPKALFTPQTGTTWALYVVDSDDDFQIESASTTQDETVEINNPGSGAANLSVEGTISSSNFSGTSSGTNTGDEALSTSSAGLDVSDHVIDLDVTPSSGSATLEQSEDALQVKYDSDAFTEGASGLAIAAGGIDGGSGGDIADASITVDDLANDAVSNAKLANMAQNTIKMRVASGSGDPEDIDISSGLTLVTAASGDFVIIEDATDGNLKRVDAADFIGGGVAWDAVADPSTSADVAFGVTEQSLSGNTNDVTATAQDLFTLNYTNDATTDVLTQRIFVINKLAASTNAVERGLVIDNKDNTALDVALEIVGTSTGAVTTAIDVSDAEIGNALAIGSNDVTVGGVTLSSSELAVLDNEIALGSETSGNYVTSVATTSPLSGGAAGSEGATLTLSITNDGITSTQIGADAVGASELAANAQLWDEIGDAGANGSVGFGDTEQIIVSSQTSGDVAALTLDINQVDDDAATDDLIAFTIDGTSESGDAGDTFTLMRLFYENGTANTVLDRALLIDNAETTASTMTDAILITSSGVDGGVVDAIDVSAANITNAINIGANNIITSGATISSAELDRLDGLSNTIVTDATAVTDVDGAGLVISSGVLAVGAGTAITVNANDIAVTADGIGPTQLDETANYDFSGVLLFDSDALRLDDTDASHQLIITPGSNLTANRVFTITTGDAARTLSLSGDLTTAAAFTTSGANALTLTTTASTNVTLPTTGTLATIAGTETFTNKTYDTQGTGNTFSDVVEFDLGPQAWTRQSATLDSAYVGSNAKKWSFQFDASTDEIVMTTLTIPSYVSGSTTFEFEVQWYSAAQTSGSVVWGLAEADVGTSENFDPALSSITYQQTTTDGTAADKNVTTITLSSPGWSGGDHVTLYFRRDADGTGGTDSMTGDAIWIGAKGKLTVSK